MKPGAHRPWTHCSTWRNIGIWRHGHDDDDDLRSSWHQTWHCWRQWGRFSDVICQTIRIRPYVVKLLATNTLVQRATGGRTGCVEFREDRGPFHHLKLKQNPIRTAKKTQPFTVTKINRLTLFKEIIAVYCENHTEHVNTKWSVTDCWSRWFI
jgi:hypothetical protein